MKEHYVSYEQSQALKRLGFAEGTTHYYVKFREDGELKFWHNSEPDNHNARVSHNDVCSAPRLDQAQAWLREVKDVVVIAEPDWDEEIQCLSDYLTGKWYFTVWKEGNRIRCNFDPSKEDEELWLFDTYELALSAGIDAVLELLTNKP